MSNQHPNKSWSSLLQFDKKTMTDIDRIIIVINKLEHRSEFNCFHTPGINPRLNVC